MVKVNDVREALHPDSCSLKDGVFTCRWGFFYRSGRTAGGYADMVRAAFAGAEVLETDEVWKNFRGGASVANQSHFLVRFRVAEG